MMTHKPFHTNRCVPDPLAISVAELGHPLSAPIRNPEPNFVSTQIGLEKGNAR